MAKIPVPFGEWRPDLATLDNEFASDVENVLVGANSYLPFPGLAALATASQSLANGGNDSYTKVLLHMDGADASTTFTDSNTGGSAHTWTANGNAQIDTADSKFGGASGLFDGTGDWVSTPDHADFALGSSDFTIDCWFKCNFAAGTFKAIAAQNAVAGAASDYSFWIDRIGTGVITAGVSNGSAFTQITGTTVFTNAVNTGWHHVALVRTGNTLKLFIDGTQEGGDVSFSGSVNNSTGSLALGRYGDSAGNEWNGWLDEFRLSVGVARWTANFTPPVVAYYLGGTCVGLVAARTAAGSFKVYAGTATRLFTWTSSGWVDVSRTTGGNYNVASGDLWMWQQVGAFLYATNINDVLQRIDVDSGTNFAAVPGSPPQATNITQIGPHTVLSGLSSNRRKIHWSATEDPTGWTIGTGLSDEQEMPDGGPVQGVAGDEIGYVVQDRSIRLMQWLPGDPTVFSFSRVVQNRGSVSKYGFLTVANILYFLSEDGFYALAGQNLVPIGDNKVNDWFLANSDPARRNVVHAFASPHAHRVFWAYHGSATSTTYDKLIYYDWALQKWSKATISAQVWASVASTGLDLDTTGGEAGDSLLDSGAASLDSYTYVGGRSTLGAVDPNGILSFQDGPNLRARLESAEYHNPMPGMRSFVNQVYPLIDAINSSNVSVYYYTRENLQSVRQPHASAVAAADTGWVNVLASARLFRFSANVEPGATWTHAQGVIVDAQPDGEA